MILCFKSVVSMRLYFGMHDLSQAIRATFEETSRFQAAWKASLAIQLDSFSKSEPLLRSILFYEGTQMKFARR